VVGRVHFNLAENRKDEQAPFAFLATYTHRLSGHGKAQHLPLGQALREYAVAALYGVGARLDERPELLFLLRGVDGRELAAAAGRGAPLQRAAPDADRLLADGDLGALFGLDLDGVGGEPDEAVAAKAKRPAAEQQPKLEKD
jgi:hypothetical protein